MRVSSISDRTPRNSEARDAFSARTSRKSEAHFENTRVSGVSPNDSVVTIAIVESNPLSGRKKQDGSFYKMGLCLGLGVVILVCVALLWVPRKPQSTAILGHTLRVRDDSCVEIQPNDDSEDAVYKRCLAKERYPNREAEQVKKLTDEQCKAIFDLHMLSDKTDLKHDTKVVDIRMEKPWVKTVKTKLSKTHKSNNEKKALRYLYKEFEKLTTVQIAVYLYQLYAYGGRKTKGDKLESKATIFPSISFSGALFNLITHNPAMRKYLAYRGLRSRLTNGKWGTIVYTDSTKFNPEKQDGWRWIGDEDSQCCSIRSYGQEGTWYSVYESQAQTKDVDGKGLHSFKNEKVEFGPTKRFLELVR